MNQWSFKRIKNFNVTYVGLDYNEQSIRDNRSKVERMGEPYLSHMEFTAVDYQSDDLANLGKADVIVLHSPYCNDDYMAVLKKGEVTGAMYNALKDRGLAIVYTENNTYDEYIDRTSFAIQLRNDNLAQVTFERQLLQTFG